MSHKMMLDSDFLEEDKFIEMPTSARLLYVYLNLYADNEGFVSSTKKALNMSGASLDDFKILIAKNFIKEMQEDDYTKVYVLTDWFNNQSEKYVYSDGYEKTKFQNARSQLVLLPVNKIYVSQEEFLALPNYESIIPMQVEKGKRKSGFIPPTIEELQEYIKEKNYTVDPNAFFDYYDTNGWKTSGKPMKCWKSAVSTWNSNNKARQKQNDKPKEINYFKY